MLPSKQKPNADWPLSPERPSLSSDEVHVWRADLDSVSSRTLSHTLSREERLRANGFHFERDRERFIVAHALVRAILGRYLEIAPEDLQFRTTPQGRPVLADPFHHISRRLGEECRNISFSISHSGAEALYAVGVGREVGVDVEVVRNDLPYEEVMNSFCSPTEQNAIQRIPEEARLDAFFRCWVRKEAYLKAKGLGLSVDPRTVTVSVDPGAPAVLLPVLDAPEEATRWRLIDLPASGRVAVALAVSGGECRVRTWTARVC